MSTSAIHKAHALVIAISDYQFARKLPEAVINDANDFAAVLRSPDLGGYDPAQVHLLLDGQATASAIRAELDHLTRSAQSDETVCIYFSGHGARDRADDHARLLPVEASQTDLAGTSISAAEFSAALDDIKAQRVLVVLDACHAAGAAVLKGSFGAEQLTLGLSAKSMDILSDGAGRAVLASSRTDEESLILHGARNSAFTTALLEGLKGGADLHNEGVIKLFALFEYASKRAASITSGQQHPVLRTKVEQNFVVALNRSLSKGVTQEAQATLAAMTRTLFDLFPALYPAGPTDQSVWERAGGDVSRLRLGQPGRAQWFEALKLIEKGGGGSISLLGLVAEALKDFPHNNELLVFS